jgi:PadR family transcriptional regulator PadR
LEEKTDVWQGTLALMVLRTLQTIGPLHGYGIARRIEQVSGNIVSVKYGTLYPALIKLEQEGYIASEWGISDHNRRAKTYRLTRAGTKKLAREARQWERTTTAIARIFGGEQGVAPGEEPL